MHVSFNCVILLQAFYIRFLTKILNMHINEKKRTFIQSMQSISISSVYLDNPHFFKVHINIYVICYVTIFTKF